MNSNSWMQLGLFVVTLLVLAKPLGEFMARVYQGDAGWLERWFGRFERMIYRVCGLPPQQEMNWKQYASAMLAFNLIGVVCVYLLQRLQGSLPLNPQQFGGVRADSALNTAISFASNTNWQGYGGEATMSYLTQMIGLNVQNFLSAATGMSVLVALIRGLARHTAETIGSFWLDVTRSTIYVLLPLSVVLAVALVSQGVVQNFRPYVSASLSDPLEDASGIVREQTLPMGPAASQIAIKQLGTNGGGFFNANSAHPFENPTPLSNFLQLLAILLIPAALCHTFGAMVGDRRQGRAILVAMLLILVPMLVACTTAEQAGNPRLTTLVVDQTASELQSGGNLEGKEVRFGIVNSTAWAVATTAASNGSVNAMHDSFTPLGGLVPMLLMQLGEVIFGGVGSGLYGMLVFAVIAVFVAGLMVGRSPEYLGKKIEAFEMKMGALVILIPCAVVLLGTALSLLGPGLSVVGENGETTALLTNSGSHGFSEVLYAWSSAGNNNGSAFGGLNANVPFYNLSLAIAMFLARYWLAIPVLAIAGSLARKRITPTSSGTLPTHTPLFVVLLAGIVIVVGALTFIPALALGPIVEQLQMTQAP